MFSSKNIFNTLYESVVRFGPNSGQNGGSRSGSPPSTANSVAGSERYIPNSGQITGSHGIAPTNGGDKRGNDKQSSKSLDTSEVTKRLESEISWNMNEFDRAHDLQNGVISEELFFEELPSVDNMAPPRSTIGGMGRNGFTVSSMREESEPDLMRFQSEDELEEEEEEATDNRADQQREGVQSNQTSRMVTMNADQYQAMVNELRAARHERNRRERETQEATQPKGPTRARKVARVPQSRPSSGTSPAPSGADPLVDILQKIAEGFDKLGDSRAQGSNAKREKLKVPAFDGNKDKATDWLEEYERICRSNGWDTEYMFTIVPSYLEGRAKRWYKTVEYDLREWDDFVDEFHRRYIPADSHHNKFVEFSSATQLREESASDFIDRVLELKARSKQRIPEQTVITVIKRGLKNATYRMAVSREDRLSTVIDIIHDYDDANENTAQDRERYGSEFKSRTNNDPPRGRNERGPDSRPQIAPRPDYRQQQTQQRPQRRPASGFQFECYNCGKMGHNHASCYAPRDQARIDAKLAEYRQFRERANRGEQPPVPPTTKSTENVPAPTVPKEVDASAGRE